VNDFEFNLFFVRNKDLAQMNFNGSELIISFILGRLRNQVAYNIKKDFGMGKWWLGKMAPAGLVLFV